MKKAILQSVVIKSIQKKLDDFDVHASSKILVGVSGGVDSMVLLTALKELNYAVIAGHVNFGLRGKESDHDATFVRSWCADHDVEFVELISDT
ncbi:MAG: ATP-binding protein, partial [Saprospiraceae bacterium]